ncbi:hypothetical protein ACJX0J_017315, partial [Zea mays]
ATVLVLYKSLLLLPRLSDNACLLASMFLRKIALAMTCTKKLIYDVMYNSVPHIFFINLRQNTKNIFWRQRHE